MAVNTSPAMTLIPIANITGSSSDLLLGVSDVQKAPEPTDPLSFIIGGPLPSNLSANVGEVGVTYTCNAGLYGRPNAASCLQALLDIPGNNREITFGNRTAGQAWNIPLPFRFISRDGTCAIEFDQTQKGSITSDEATGFQMSAAAWDLIQKCSSIQTKDRGGIATGLGEKGRVSLVVQEYKPNVQCGVPSFSATGGVREACQAALNTLPVSTFSQTFGAKGTPDAEIELPKSYSDDNSRCFVTVDITGAAVAANWYDIWAGAVAVMGICVLDGKAGVSAIQVGGSKITVRMQIPPARTSLSSTK